VDDLADELIAAQRSAEAVALLERQIADHPYRDRSRGLLIRGLASGGRQGDALRAFQDYRSLLIDELGTEPSADVVRIERRVATGWDGVVRASGPQASAGTLDLPPPRLLAPARFVGRIAELDALAEELAVVSAQKLRGLVITGEPGIGKTSLLAAFADSVAKASAATVLFGRCEESGVPLEPFGTVLRLCVEHAPGDTLTGHVARCGGELMRICPTLATRVTTTPVPVTSDTATERHLTFEAAGDLLRRIAAQQPLVLLLDDLQWAEPTALLLLRHLARVLADEPILLVMTCRDVDGGTNDGLRLALAELERGEMRRLSLGGLDGPELAELATGAMGLADEAEVARVAHALHRDTAGNPLYASQLLRHWRDAGTDGLPSSLRDLIWSRVHGLGGEVPSVLTSASVLGTEFHEDVLADMVDLPDPIVSDAVDAAAAAGLLFDTGSVRRTMRFVHSLVAHALYSELGGSRRARLHERAARALEKRFEHVPPDVVVQLARHAALAGMAVDAQLWATRAGDHAFDQLAPIEAAEHYRVALEMATSLDRPGAERADLLVRLGDAQHRAGDPRALETLELGADLARRNGADGSVIRAAFAADRGFMRIDSDAATFLDIVEAAVRVADPSDTATYARLLALLAQNLVYTPEAERRFSLARQALDLATGADDPTLLARISPPVLYALWAPGSGPTRASVAAAAISAAEASGDPRLEFAAHAAAYDVAIEAADHVAAARSLAALRAVARDRGEPRMRWTAALFETFDATMAGRLEAAEALANHALELGVQIGDPDAFTFFAGQYFVIGTFAGRHDELFPLVEQAARDNPGVLPFEIAYAIISAAVGATETAQAFLDQGMANGFEGIPVDNMWTTSVIGYAVIALELEDRDAAAQLLPIITPLEGTVAFNGVTSQGPISAYVGKLASLVGEHDLAEDHLQDALETATTFGWPYHRATTLIGLAQARHRRLGGLDEDARTWLAEATDLCRRGGFHSWIAKIDELVGGEPEVHRLT
jgi:tetratricopeptide (TPR) repeat protein